MTATPARDHGKMGALRKAWADAVRLDPSGLTLRFAVRCTIGVALPLIAAVAAGQQLDGVSAAYGALVTGFASRQGVYRTRVIAMALTAVALAVAACTGVASVGLPAVNVVVIAVWCLVFGLVGALGTTAMAISFNSVVALILFSNAPYDTANGLTQGAMVLAGGALQMVLQVLVWPLQRSRAQRDALASAYDALAVYAAAVDPHDLGLPETRTLSELATVLADPQPFVSRDEYAAFVVLADEAERLRASLAVMATDSHLLDDVGLSRAAQKIQRVCTSAATILVAVAKGLRAAQVPGVDAPAWAALDDAVKSLDVDRAGDATYVDDARALAGQLRSVWSAATATVTGGLATGPIHRPGVSIFDGSMVREAFETLRANATWSSSYGRHAIRLCVAVTMAVTLQHVLPLQHGQWIGLTVALVLRPEFASTLTRGFQRIVGTLAGAIFASAIAALHPSNVANEALVVVFAFLGFALFNVSYGLFSATITGYVVFLLAFGGSPEETAAYDRVLATAIGGVLALVLFVVWPAWSRTRVAGDIARLIDTQQRYLLLVLRMYVDPATRDDRAIRDAATSSRLARSNAETSVELMAAEPVRPRDLSVRAARALLAETRRSGVAGLVLYARATRAARLPPPAAALLATLSAHIEEAGKRLTESVRSADAGAPDFPPLRADQVALTQTLEHVPHSDFDVLISETDLIVDSLNSSAAILARRTT
jgi:uncharacterized membrane protein YccC